MKLILSIFLLVCMFQISTEAAILKSKSGYVKFTAVGKPGFLKIRGESSGTKPEGLVEIKNGTLTGEFTFELKNLKTGIDLRDEHMKEKYLQAAKFPTAKLIINPMQVDEKKLDDNIKTGFKGALTLHGVTKEISGSVEYTGKNKNIVANFKVELADFGISIPEHMGITVSKTADVEINLEFTKE